VVPTFFCIFIFLQIFSCTVFYVMWTYRFAGAQAVLDVALEDDSVGLREPEGLVSALQRRAVGGESVHCVHIKIVNLKAS
jgi:hypothetical protein